MELSLEDLRKGFRRAGYICGDEILVPVYLALRLGKPLLVEGEPGVGKTEIAKVLSRAFDAELIRLQCYEGLDETKALYEWNYQKQLLRIQAGRPGDASGVPERDLFSEEYLLERPLLKALRAARRPVLLIDEVDKCDEEFEAFLFEVLSDFQVSVPELGTVKARNVPIVVLTSNRARELSDGLKRRCVFLFIDFPSVAKEAEIISVKVPEAPARLRQEIAAAAGRLRRGLELRKKPSIAETLDWTRALVALDADRLEPSLVRTTLNLVLKTRDDMESFDREIGPEALVELARAGTEGGAGS